MEINLKPQPDLWLPLLLSLIFLTAWRQILPVPLPISPLALPAREDNFSLSSPPIVPLSERSVISATTISEPECSPYNKKIGGVISGTLEGGYCIVNEDLLVPAGET